MRTLLLGSRGLYRGDPGKFEIRQGNQESLERSPLPAPLSFCQAVALGCPLSPEQYTHSSSSPPAPLTTRWRPGSPGNPTTHPGFPFRQSQGIRRGHGAGGKLSLCNRRPRRTRLGTPRGSRLWPGYAAPGESSPLPSGVAPPTHHQGLHFGHLFCAESSGTRVRSHFFLAGFHGG